MKHSTLIAAVLLALTASAGPAFAQVKPTATSIGSVPSNGGDAGQTVIKPAGATVALAQAKRMGMMPLLVSDFGAKCDGTTDDTAAVRAGVNAINAAGGELLFPGPGLCAVNTDNGGALLLSAGTSVVIRGVGDGGLLNKSVNGTDTFFVGGAAGPYRAALIKFEDIKLWANGTNGSGIHAQLATNLKIERASFYKNGNIGIFGDATYGISIDKSTLSANGPAGIYLDNNGGNGSRITENTITAHTGAGVSLDTAYAVYIAGNNIENNPFGVRLVKTTGTFFAGNYMENNASGAVELSIDSTNSGTTVTGNTLFGYSVLGPNGLTLTGNTFLGQLATGPFTSVADLTGALNVAVGGNTVPTGGSFVGAALEQGPGRTISGNLTVAGGVAAGAPIRVSGATGLTAAGTTQGTATALTKDVNVVTTVASGTGVGIGAYSATGVQRQEVFNRGANALLVFPPAGAAIEGGAVNAAFSLAVGGHAAFECTSPTQCYAAP